MPLKETAELWVLPFSIFLFQAPAWGKWNETSKIMSQSKLSLIKSSQVLGTVTENPLAHYYQLMGWVTPICGLWEYYFYKQKTKLLWVPASTSSRHGQNIRGLCTIQEVELLDQMVILYLTLWGTNVLCSKAAASFYIPTSNTQEF